MTVSYIFSIGDRKRWESASITIPPMAACLSRPLGHPILPFVSQQFGVGYTFDTPGDYYLP
jgi:hypothetical protein